MPYTVSKMCITNYKDRFLFVSGGVIDDEVVQNVIKYDVLKDTWSAAP